MEGRGGAVLRQPLGSVVDIVVEGWWEVDACGGADPGTV